MTSRLLEFWNKASIDLDLETTMPFYLTLTSGHEIRAIVLVEYFGAQKGMLIFDEYSEIAPYENEVIKSGYGFSVLDEPLPNEKYDKYEFIEMLKDWGWCGSAKSKPKWFK